MRGLNPEFEKEFLENGKFRGIIEYVKKQDDVFLGVRENYINLYVDGGSFFKLEYKISKIEEEIKMLDVQIQASKDIHDFTTVEILNNRKKLLKEEHENLTALYNDASISTKISGGLTDGLRAKLLVFKQLIASYTENLISKLPAPFSSVIELKKSLSKLEIINKNVDELMKLNTPYGEAYDKYEQLSKYIVRANSIQSEIAKSLK